MMKEEVPTMRAAKMKERPSFQLMVQTDVQSIYHMQMPRWLFSDIAVRLNNPAISVEPSVVFLTNADTV